MAYSYYPNNQFYMQDLQNMRDKIDRQMQQMNQNQMQMQQPVPNVTQNFQIAPTPNNNNELESKYANSIDEVKNTFVMTTGIFINKDLSTLWIKNTNGNIRAFQLNEIIEQDPKDIEIQSLRSEIERMKGMINYESVNTNVNDETATKKSATVQARKSSNAK